MGVLGVPTKFFWKVENMIMTISMELPHLYNIIFMLGSCPIQIEVPIFNIVRGQWC